MRAVEAAGLRVSAIGLGTWQFGTRGWGWGTRFGPRDALGIVRRAIELGITLIDTAELYGRGMSELLLGEVLSESDADGVPLREKVVLATKVLPSWPTAPRVVQAARGSSTRLHTRCIDLYQVHWPNPAVPQRSTMRGMRQLHQQGLVGHVGVSNYGLRRWQAAERELGFPVVSNQVRFNLLQSKAATHLVPYAISNDRLVIAYSPLAQGALTGRFGPNAPPTGARQANVLFAPENLRRAAPLIDTLREVAAGKGATPAQIALAWLIAHPQVVAIPGATSIAQLESNVAAAALTLTLEEAAALTAAAGRFRVERMASSAARLSAPVNQRLRALRHG